jgi:cell division septation protein DedD
MIRTSIMLVILTLVVMTVAVLAGEPTEQEKTDALKLGYMLNGNSMKRELSEGSIDVTGLSNLMVTPPPGVVRTIPITPAKKARDK